jgi:uncharacterized protein YndB with AHSA1/START domain
MATNIVTLHRIFKSRPEKIFRAFSNVNAYAWWIPPYGFLCSIEKFEFKVGGKFRMSFTNFSTGNEHSFGGEILELIPNQLIKYTDQFDNPDMPGQMTTTVELREAFCGTELRITQEGIPAEIPVELCYLGWQESLEKLALLTDPEIPDE